MRLTNEQMFNVWMRSVSYMMRQPRSTARSARRASVLPGERQRETRPSLLFGVVLLFYLSTRVCPVVGCFPPASVECIRCIYRLIKFSFRIYRLFLFLYKVCLHYFFLSLSIFLRSR